VNKKVGNRWESHYECQFVPGWKGLVDLMNRSGQGSVWTGAVFEGDDFDWALGDSPYIRHRPGEGEGGRLIFTYAVGRVKGQDWPIIDVWPIAKVWKHRDRYNKVGERHYSYENPEMYARKIPLLQVLKYMPCSAELATAIALNDDAEIGKQKIDMSDAIEGTYTPVDPTDDAQEDAELRQGMEGAGKVDTATGEIQQQPQQQQKAPTVGDALALARAGDFDAAVDMAASMDANAQQQVQNEIARLRKASK
jgi:recombination protein RecT